MEQYFVPLFEDDRHGTNLILFLSLTDPGILQQSKFTDHELKSIKDLALEKLHRQKILGVCCCFINRMIFSI